MRFKKKIEFEFTYIFFIKMEHNYTPAFEYYLKALENEKDKSKIEYYKKELDKLIELIYDPCCWDMVKIKLKLK